MGSDRLQQPNGKPIELDQFAIRCQHQWHYQSGNNKPTCSIVTGDGKICVPPFGWWIKPLHTSLRPTPVAQPHAIDEVHFSERTVIMSPLAKHQPWADVAVFEDMNAGKSYSQ